MADHKHTRKDRANPLALWIAIGPGVGVAPDDIALGLGIGIALDVAIGLAQSRRGDQE
jgi:hypothetical protein